MSMPPSPPSPLSDVLAASGLPARWQGRERLVVLDLGLGAADRFSALLAAWHADPLRCERLVVLATDGPDSADHADGRVQWMRLADDPATALRGLQAQVDVFWLGDTPAVSGELVRRLHRVAAPGATLWSARPDPTDHAQFPLRYLPPRPAAFRPPHQGLRTALVIGAGLAGCAAAWALARQGWHATVLDRQAAPAQETSGNPAGLMHGTFNAPDSLHARWFRAAARCTARLAGPAIASGAVAGDLGGFLRLEHRLDAAQAAAQCALVGLPADYVRWIERAQAGADTGLALASGGWWYGQAGWMSPGDWSRWLLAQAVDAGQARFQGNTAVARLRQAAEGHGWQALDADGQVLAQAPVVVLATALAVDRLLPEGAATVAMHAVRGQTTLLAADTPGLQPPRRALSGQGYGLTLPDGRVFTGATTQHHDSDPSVRQTDHLHNLTRAARLGLCASADAAVTGIVGGRVGWRATTADRLPCIGPPLDLRGALSPGTPGAVRQDSLQHRPRWHGAVDGLYVFTGLGARGITSAALGAQVLASWVTGAPFPVDAALRDALDPGRG